MKTIITYGTFDLIHTGHIHLLERARALGDRLIVGLSTDAFNLEKNKLSVFPYALRKILLEAIPYVYMVIPEENWQQKIKDIITHKVDTFVIGDDWQGKFDALNPYCEVIYLPRTEGISTSMIKQQLHSSYQPQ